MSSTTPTKSNPPSTKSFTPHPYQTQAITHILNHPEAALFLGMGMGKTIITLTALNTLINDTFHVHHALIIAPKRVAESTWPTELKKWTHLKNLTYTLITGNPTQRTTAANTNTDLHIISRDNITWLTTNTNWKWDMIVIDELSSFKNHQAKRFKALMKQRKHINRVVGLTGTPAPNGLLDLWAQFALIDKGKRLGKYVTHYRTNYFYPERMNGHQVYTWGLKKGAAEAIETAIQDITLSDSITHQLDLPPLTIVDKPIPLPATVQKQIRELEKNYILELGDDVIDAVHAASLSGKLRQLASGAIYVDQDTDRYTEIHHAKLDALEDAIEAANGQPLLVAYEFRHEHERIKKRFPNARDLATADDIAAWNRGEIPIALIHPQSAGHGLNLQDGGHLMVWMTLPWSLEAYEQANARLFRQGQKHPVSIIRMIAQGTIDETVSEVLQGKAATQQGLVAALRDRIGAIENMQGQGEGEDE